MTQTCGTAVIGDNDPATVGLLAESLVGKPPAEGLEELMARARRSEGLS